MLLGQLHALGLTLGNERQGAALAHDDDDAVTVRQVGLEATVLPVLLAVLRAHNAAEVRAVDLDLTLKTVPRRLSRKGLAQLVSKDEGRLMETSRSRPSRSADRPFTAFVKIATAAHGPVKCNSLRPPISTDTMAFGAFAP